MPKRTGDAESVSSEPPASSAQWRSRIGPLLSIKAESVAVSAAIGTSSTSPQIRKLGESHDSWSTIPSLADPAPSQPPFEPLHLSPVGLVVVAQAMQDAMQQEDLELALHGVS